MKYYVILGSMLLTTSCVKEHSIIRMQRSQEIIVSGSIAYRNFEYQFFPRTRLYADGEMVKKCISIIPSDAIRGLINTKSGKSKIVSAKAAVYRYPDDFLPRGDETIMTHHLTLSCGSNNVLLIREIIK